MERQYIGARYVPKFYEGTNGNNWDANASYEPLTVVTYLNSSYTSKKPVPATVGSPAENTEYWALTGNYSGQISELTERIGAVENDVDVLEPIVESNTAKVNLLTKKRCIFISDSYGTVTDSFISKVVSLLGLSASDYYSSAVAGAGFKPPYNSYFLTYLQNLASTVSKPETITDIVVVGGFNDRSTTLSDLNSAISAFCSYCKTTYPNAKIWIGGFGWSMNGEYQGELVNGRYLTAYKNCSVYGANFLHGSNTIMHNFANYLEEAVGSTPLSLGHQYVHPNGTGSQLIANCIAENLNGNGFEYMGGSGVTLTAATGVTFQYANFMSHTLVGDKIIVSMNQTRIDFTDAQSDSGLTWIELGTLPEGCISGTNARGCVIPCMQVEAFVAGGNYTANTSIPVQIAFFNNKIHMKICTGADMNFTVMYILKGYFEFTNIMV